jgi:hypothetical protein
MPTTSTTMLKARGPPGPHLYDRAEFEERRNVTGVKCIHGASTERPCPRPGTVPYWEDDPSGVKVCDVHHALEPLTDELLDLSLALDKLAEVEEYAREWNNRPLLALLKRAKAEFAERKSVLDQQLERVEHAIR